MPEDRYSFQRRVRSIVNAQAGANKAATGRNLAVALFFVKGSPRRRNLSVTSALHAYPVGAFAPGNSN